MGAGAGSGLHLLDYLFEQPIISVRLVEQHLKSSFVTANKLVGQFIRLGILNETTGRRRNRRHSYTQYLALFEGWANQVEE